MTKKKTYIRKDLEVKSVEYPVIYSYIYERETEDIKRLTTKFQHLKAKPATVEVKKIIGFRKEGDKIIPIYEEIDSEVNRGLRPKPTRRTPAKSIKPAKSIPTSRPKNVDNTKKDLK